MNPNKALWEKGDFTKIAETFRENGTIVVDKIAIKPGDQVLDLGCGDGTTAIPEAQRGANVLGVDIASNLVEAGKKRAEKENLPNCRFEEGDATDLNNLKDATFDWTISFFGAMFAPKPYDVAKEMVRVTKPGGTIIMGNWIPGDPTLVAQILKTSAAYTPPPPDGFVSPMLWGVEDEVVARFGAAGIPRENISFARDTLRFNTSFPPKQLLEMFRTYYGPTMNAFEAAAQNGKEDQLQRELETLFENQNQDKSQQTTAMGATFLWVTVKL